MTKACEFCNAWEGIPGAPDIGLCKAKSPTAHIVGMQQGSVKGLAGQRTASPVVATIFPEMPKTGWCREFILDIEKVPFVPTKPFLFGLTSRLDENGKPIIP